MKCPHCGSTKIKKHNFVGESKPILICKVCEKVINLDNNKQ